VRDKSQEIAPCWSNRTGTPARQLFARIDGMMGNRTIAVPKVQAAIILCFIILSPHPMCSISEVRVGWHALRLCEGRGRNHENLSLRPHWNF